jgi:hypothetical protein
MEPPAPPLEPQVGSYMAQVPIPSQVVQDPQGVLDDGNAHEPTPSQVDLHRPVPLPHSFSGSEPAPYGLHLPGLPARHDTQVPLQALSQHTPSTQKPEAQMLVLVHACPLPLLQLPLPSQA